MRSILQKGLSYLVISILTAQPIFAVDISAPEKLPIFEQFEMKSPDEIKKVDEKLFLLGIVFELPTYSFYLGSPDIYGKAYVPNFAARVGPKLLYKKVGIKTTFSLDIPDRERARRGDSDQDNFTLSFYWRQHAFDFYYQYYRGFYAGNPLIEVSGNRPNRFSQLPDAESVHYGFNWYYNVNPQQFSLNSAFDQTESVLEEGDGWVLIPFFRHWEIDMGKRIVLGTEPSDLQTVPALASGRFETFGTSLAYACTWVFDRFYLSTLGGVGPGLQNQHYRDKGVSQDELTFAGKINLNGSLGFKKNELTVGSSLTLDSIYSQVSGIEIYSTYAALEFFLNRRF